MVRVIFATYRSGLPKSPTWKLTGGGLAQLGERLAGSQKVRGSNPLSSTFVFREADMTFMFENLKVYQKALDPAEPPVRLIQGFDRGKSHVAEALR